MNHSKKYELVRRYYNTWYNDTRLWSTEKLLNAVRRGWITEAEFTEITGEAYSQELS